MNEWKRSIVRVWCGTPNKGGEYRGTAFLISPSHLVTAKHVLEEPPCQYNKMFLQGPAWYDGGLYSINKPIYHPSLDVAILELKKASADNTNYISIASTQTKLEQGLTIALAGYSTPEAGLEIPSVQISSYNGIYDMEITHTSIAKGMSGGPAILNSQLIGIICARSKDGTKSYLIPISAFRNFIAPYAKCNQINDTFPIAWNPPRTPDPFIGREKDLKRIKGALGILPKTSGIKSKIITVHGVPGVGKSTFAAWLANDRDILQAFPDAVLWSAFGQFGSSSDSDFEIRARLKSWGYFLGDEHLHSSMQINDMSQRLANMLRNRRALLICDDVWNVDHISAIRCLADGDVRLLVTSRLTDVAESVVSYPDGVFKLKVFVESDAVALLKIVAPEVVEKYPTETTALVNDLEYLPLAINVAGHLLQREMKAGLDVVSLIEELRAEGKQLLDAEPPLDMMELIREAKSPTVAAWLKRSTKMLDADTLQCFISLGYIAPKPATFGSDVLSLVWQDQDVKSVIRRLFDLGLIQTIGNKQYQMHALLVTLARSMEKEISDG